MKTIKSFSILLIFPILFAVSCNDRLQESIEPQKTTIPAPIKMRATFPTNSFTGTLTDEGRTYFFLYQYNLIEDKPYSITLQLISGQPIVVDNQSLDDIMEVKKSPKEFFDDGMACSRLDNVYASAICHNANLADALMDCVKYRNCKHCWMEAQCQ